MKEWLKKAKNDVEAWWRSGGAQQDLNLFISVGDSQRAHIAEFTGEDSEFDPTLFGDKSFLILKTAREDELHGTFTETFYCVMYNSTADSNPLIFGIDQDTIVKNIESNYWPAKGAKKIPTERVAIGGSIIGGESNSTHTIERIEVYKLGFPFGIRQPVVRSTRRVVPNAA